ncbi:DUF7096 domain-containing protein [Halopiger goleimassiliensis]|uniref:DUF7096 domain-containing protein n=1 Tax=Halopiger goleimassiliensis TaxID=1293048 RepID=UPI000677AE73|nr:hypothetical protein [Halopiger goleimassiliensis]
MKSATPSLLALLLVLSLPATALVAADVGVENDAIPSIQDGSTSQDTPVHAENTTNRLPLSGEPGSEYSEYGPDLGITLASVDDELRVDHDQYVLVDSEFERASDDEREAMLETAHEHLIEAIDDLRERERTAVREHATGVRSDTELTQTLLRNYHEATALLDVMSGLEERADEVPGYSLGRDQVRENKRALEIHRSPLQSQLAATSQRFETPDSFEFLIQTSEESYRLSAIDGSTYLSETTRFDNRDPDAPDQFDGSVGQTANDYASELYPWGAEEGSTDFRAAGKIYDVGFTGDHFELRLYFDGGSGEVYRELQELSIDTLPIQDRHQMIADGLVLETSTTPVNGPVELNVTDAETDDPVEATIIVDGSERGVTDEDGTLWIVPPSDEFELTVETDTGSINTTVTAGS